MLVVAGFLGLILGTHIGGGDPCISSCGPRSRQSSEGFGYSCVLVAGVVSGDRHWRESPPRLDDRDGVFRWRIRPSTRYQLLLETRLSLSCPIMIPQRSLQGDQGATRVV